MIAAFLVAFVAFVAFSGLADGHDNSFQSRLKKRSIESDQKTCAKGEFSCPNESTKCLKARSFCDTKDDCGDGSDEADCASYNPSRASAGCTPANCKLPGCACPMVDAEKGALIPGGLSLKETPQMVMLTLSGGLTPEVSKVIDAVFNNPLINPNGCQARSTFFANNDVTDYSLISSLYNRGHEIGVHGVTGRNDFWYWKGLKVEELGSEFYGMRQLLVQHANISVEDIRGVRAPALAYQGNNLFEVLSQGKDNPFTYDSSISVPHRAFPWWPFTLDYFMGRCHSENRCPTRSFKGVWELPLNRMDNKAFAPGSPFRKHVDPGCPTLDSCWEKILNDENQMFDFLMHAFMRHYTINRAPLNLAVQPATLLANPAALKAVQRFLGTILQPGLEDVYLVRASDVIEWMKKPTKVGSDLKAFQPWIKRCLKEDSAPRLDKHCSITICKFPLGDRDSFYRSYCGPCPNKFPSVSDLRATSFLRDH